MYYIIVRNGSDGMSPAIVVIFALVIDALFEKGVGVGVVLF